jgi:hypothetical protein
MTSRLWFMIGQKYFLSDIDVLPKYPLRLAVTRSTDLLSHTLFNMPYIIQNLFIVCEKEMSSSLCDNFSHSCNI